MIAELKKSLLAPAKLPPKVAKEEPKEKDEPDKYQ
jgi:hypothetical protein